MASLDYYMPNWQMGTRKPQAAKKPGLLAGMAAGPKAQTPVPDPYVSNPMLYYSRRQQAKTGQQPVSQQPVAPSPVSSDPYTSNPMLYYNRRQQAKAGQQPVVAPQPPVPPASTEYRNYTGGFDANGNTRAGIPVRDTVVSGAVKGRLAQIMLDQAQRQKEFKRGVKESLQRQDVLHQELSDSLPYLIEHGIAPNQVKGQPEDYVDMLTQEAAAMDGRFQVTPTVRGETGMVQHAPNMPGWLAEQVARQKAQQQRNANWSLSKDTSLPGQAPVVVNVSPGDVNPAEYQTADGFNAAQSRAIQGDPAYQAQLAAHKAYLAARANGQDAAAPPPVHINKQQPSGDMMTYHNGIPQKYSDYKAGLADKREGRLAKAAQDLARRKLNVQAKARDVSPMKLWAENQVMNGGSDMAASPDGGGMLRQYALDNELYGPVVANQNMDRLNARQMAKSEQDFKKAESLAAFERSKDPALAANVLASTQADVARGELAVKNAELEFKKDPNSQENLVNKQKADALLAEANAAAAQANASMAQAENYAAQTKAVNDPNSPANLKSMAEIKMAEAAMLDQRINGIREQINGIKDPTDYRARSLNNDLREALKERDALKQKPISSQSNLFPANSPLVSLPQEYQLNIRQLLQAPGAGSGAIMKNLLTQAEMASGVMLPINIKDQLVRDAEGDYDATFGSPAGEMIPGTGEIRRALLGMGGIQPFVDLFNQRTPY